MIKNTYLEFILWLKGVVEDDPIPYEIKSLVFYINNNNEIGFSGTERENVEIIDKYFYEPLEAQYFFCSKLYESFFNSNVTQNLKILEQLLLMLKGDREFSKFNLFYGKLYAKSKKI